MESEESSLEMIERPSVVAGNFYPSNPVKLEQQIRSWSETENIEREPVMGIIVPHGGYERCGEVLVETYQKTQTPDVYILIGPNHGLKSGAISLFPRGIWVTPLGKLEVDYDLAKNLKAECNKINEDPAAHENEHSLEVQLPVLQVLAQKPFKILPILMQTKLDVALCKELAQALFRTMHTTNRKIVIVATTDLSQDLSPEMANRKDQKLIHTVVHLELEELTGGVKRFGFNYCGINPVITLLMVMKELGATGGELVTYITHGESEEDFARVNGYAGILLK